MSEKGTPLPGKPAPGRRRFRWRLPRPVIGTQLLSILGLIIGFAVYQAAARLPLPWSSVVVGLLFVGLGILAWWYARGERWIRVLALALALYGVIRMFLK